jgi:hypothetical protein
VNLQELKFEVLMTVWWRVDVRSLVNATHRFVGQNFRLVSAQSHSASAGARDEERSMRGFEKMSIHRSVVGICCSIGGPDCERS